MTTEQGYKRILVAMDFSPSADAALQQAVWLARKVGAKITLAHTLPDLRRVVHTASYQARLDLLSGEGSVFEREVRQESDTRMRKIVVDLNAADLDVTVETLLGAPYTEITHSVQQEGYDLVLAGSRGLGAWERFFVGSTARRLIRNCPASVWIVKAEHVGAPKVVLASTDFSEASRKAVLHGLWVATQANADFHLLHVFDSMDIPENVIAKEGRYASLRREINEDATQRLEAFVQSLDSDRSRVHSHLSWGTPWKEICRAAQHLSIDLITLGTVGRSGIKGVLLGNTAEQVLGTCDCSILTVKPDGFVSPIEPASWPLHPGPNPGAASHGEPEVR